MHRTEKEEDHLSVCPHCGSRVTPEYYTKLMNRWNIQKTRDFSEVYWNPFAGWVETEAWHCIEEATAFEDDNKAIRQRADRLQAVVKQGNGGRAQTGTPATSACLYCNRPIDEGIAKSQSFEMEHGFKLDNTAQPHCVEERLALEQVDSHRKIGRGRNPEISRIAAELGISRDAARKRRKRQPH